MSDYLWDKSGDPDPGIQKLESLLSPLGRQPRRPRRRPWVPVAIAASILVVGGAVWFALHRPAPNQTLSARAGQSIHTGAGSRAMLELEDVGEVQIEPNTQVRVVTMRPEENRLELQRGIIHAQIWAPPGRFYVNTPSSVTVDLGCAYTLEVDGNGAGLVKVSVGWVAFEDHGRESFIPASAACVTRPGKGPGLPYYQDSSSTFQAAVARFDVNAEEAAVTRILTESRPRDAITLWHLLRRLPVQERGLVYDRLGQLIHIPASVTREGVLAGNAGMTDALWDTLDLGDTGWWRMWKNRAR